VTDLTGITGTAVSSGSLPWNDYFWRVRAVNTTGAGAWSETRKFTVHEVVSVEELDGDIPSSFALYPNYPNPFNPTTMIRFDVASTVSVRLAVYDALGRRVAQLVDRTMSAGSYEFSWDATGFESGFYLYRLQAGPYSKTGSMVLLK